MCWKIRFVCGVLQKLSDVLENSFLFEESCKECEERNNLVSPEFEEKENEEEDTEISH